MVIEAMANNIAGLAGVPEEDYGWSGEIAVDKCKWQSEATRRNREANQ